MDRDSREYLVRQLREEGIRHEGLLDIILHTPRHAFVERGLDTHAYENIPLPIGHHQTISQPYVVARMTEALLEGGALKRVLEIGTGSGYQAAILAQCAEEVYTIERIHELYVHATEVLDKLNIKNVYTFYGNGETGLPQYAPFDGIMITAGLHKVPDALLSQLAVGGRMIAPVGDMGEQELQLITRTPEGFQTEHLDAVRFVPFKGGVE